MLIYNTTSNMHISNTTINNDNSTTTICIYHVSIYHDVLYMHIDRTKQ